MHVNIYIYIFASTSRAAKHVIITSVPLTFQGEKAFKR